MVHHGPRSSRRLALFCLAAVATLFALILAELAVRLAFPSWAPRTARMTTFWQYHPRYGWAHVPGAAGRFSSPGFDTSVRMNAHGFRGRDIPHARQGAASRVVVLGDSHVWGFGVEEDETFCRILEQTIPDLEVVNLGVSGYSTDQELLLYQDEGVRYAADLVVIFVAHNDLRGNTRTIESSVYGKPRFLIQGDELVLDNHPVPAPSWLRRTAFDLSARSYVLTRTLRILDDSRRAADVALGAASAEGSHTARRESERLAPFPRTPSQEITARLLVELQRAVARQQPAARLLVVFADLRDGLGQEAAEYLEQFGVASVSLDRYLDHQDPAWHLPDGLHWTAAGHARVAEALAPRLRSLILEGAFRSDEAHTPID